MTFLTGHRIQILMILVLATFSAETAVSAVIHVPGDYPTIQEAIDASVDGDEIIVAPGTYNEAIRLYERQIYLHSSAGARQTIIDGAGLHTSVIACSGEETADTVIEGFKVINGEGFGSGPSYGGAVHLFNASPTFIRCIFQGNGDVSYGGAVYTRLGSPRFIACAFANNTCVIGGGAVYEESSPTAYERCVFIGNRATGCSDGGAVYSDLSDSTFTDCLFNINDATAGAALYAYHADLIVQGCTFEANHAHRGGAIYADNCDAVLVEDCEFNSNSTGDEGGAIFSYLSGLEIKQSTFENNRTKYGGGAVRVDQGYASFRNSRFLSNRVNDARGNDSGGGAIWSRDARARISDCLFQENYADNHGGAVVCSGNNAIISRSHFEHNTGRSGGGLQLYRCYAAIVACIFTENHAVQDGGAIHAYGRQHQSNIINCIGVRNSAETGGALALENRCYLFIDNSTFVDNTATMQHGGNLLGTDSYGRSHVRFQNSILRNGEAEINNGNNSYIEIEYCNITNGHTGDGNIDDDPMFVDPANDDYRLRPGSWCIDAGKNAALPPDVETDLDGNPRFVDSEYITDSGRGDAPIIDMGAYEFQALTHPTITVSPDPLVVGEVATFSVTDARGAALTHLVYSLQGPGETVFPPLYVTLDILAPRQLLIERYTDADGHVEWEHPVPTQAAGLDVWFQAAQFTLKTDVAATSVH